MATLREPARNIPVMDEAEVVVVGGGPAGFVAAVAAARNGADVLLVERYGCLGGLATGGLVIFLDAYGDKGEIIIQGLARETWDRLKPYGGESARRGTTKISPMFDPEIFKFVALEMIEEAKVRMLLHCWAAGVVKEGEDIVAVVVESKAGRRAIRGQRFIDCTGDGDLADWSGAPFVEAEHPWGLGLPGRLANVDGERVWAFAQEDPERWSRLRRQNTEQGGIGFPTLGWRPEVIWLNNRVPGYPLNVHDLTNAEIMCRKGLMKTLFFVRKNVPGCENAFLMDTASQMGTRESRLITGELTITQDNLAEARRQSIGLVDRRARDGRPVAIPYGSLVPQRVDNLLVAGRSISVSHDMLDTVRLIPHCMVSGQGAGTAAAMSCRQGVAPRTLDLASLQSRLAEQGVNLGPDAQPPMPEQPAPQQT
ncbi:MAG: FAD-dependent oxidoreductase [Bacteroidetes bacterium]|nr:FAD-dependent oxidoreductase [Bacteroidota bacterium]MCL5026857.1 FAD-dependent oxidoreductase [Chloroflexota bacterium]